MTRPTNLLASETSAYLRSAAHQPVAWHTWSAEAFDAARKQDRPILLDIGAVWCHWCHVMDHESYDDPEVAKLINEHFVAIKVDRDERPDIDARYQRAVQAITGQGGWPLTAFLLPDGRVFYGGTYFPPRDAHGRPGFPRVLTAISETFHERKEDALGNAEKLTTHIQRMSRPKGGTGMVSDEALAEAVSHMQRVFDGTNGGFGEAPKFPHPAAHDFLIARASNGDAAARDMAAFTLERMRAGGVYDQLAGGFHRYSVDARWHVPHFEKMLYDNAGLLRNQVRAFRVTGREDFRRTSHEIVAFLRDVLGQPQGGFGGSQDADIGPDDDGDHFTWTLAEVQEAIGDERIARLVAMHLDVQGSGDMHHDPARNVLRVVADAEALAAALKRDVTEVQTDLEEGLRRMREARMKRPVPFIDPTRYASWNGMAIQALLEHGGTFQDDEADRLALKALDVFLDEAFDARRGFARTPGSEMHGLLDDNAQMLDALIEAHVATGKPRYLEAAKTVADLLVTHFPHEAGGFQDRSMILADDAEAATLAVAERPTQDAPTASPNGVAVRALRRLAELTGEARHRELADAALGQLAGEAQRLSLFGGALLLAMHEALHPPARIVVAASDVAGFRRVVREHAPPGSVLLEAGPDVAVPHGQGAWEGALVCFGDRCLAPAQNPTELMAQLDHAYGRRGG